MILLLVGTVLVVPVFAQNHGLDPGFDGDGWTRIDPGGITYMDGANAVALQPDGKILIGGYTTNATSNDFCLARLHPNGALDTTFGGNGIVVTSFPYTSVGSDMALLADGRIVLAGHAWNNGKNNFAVCRYLADGSPDTSFGNAGMLIAGFPGKDAVARSLVVQPDGRLILGGHVYTLANDFDEFAMLRTLADGSIDSSFGNQGWVATSFGAGTQNWIHDMVLESDGDIVAAGFSDFRVALARYLPTGDLDTTFGNLGTMAIGVPGRTQASLKAVELGPNGDIWCAGFAVDSLSDFLVARFRADGQPDSAFGQSGFQVLALSQQQDGAEALAWQPDGKLVVGGSLRLAGTWRSALVRYQANGDRDTTFGTQGLVDPAIGTGDAFLHDLVIQPDMKPVAAGQMSWGGILVARYTELVLGQAWAASEGPECMVVPNPVGEEAQLQVLLTKPQAIEWDLYNMQGQLVRQMKLGVQPGGWVRRALPVANLPEGMYLLQVKGRDFEKTIRLIR